MSVINVANIITFLVCDSHTNLHPRLNVPFLVSHSACFFFVILGAEQNSDIVPLLCTYAAVPQIGAV